MEAAGGTQQADGLVYRDPAVWHMGRGSWKAGLSGAVGPTWGVSGLPVLPVAQAPISGVPMNKEEGPWSLRTQPREAQSFCTLPVKAVTGPTWVPAEGTQSYSPLPTPSLQREEEKSVKPWFRTTTSRTFTEYMCQRASPSGICIKLFNPYNTPMKQLHNPHPPDGNTEGQTSHLPKSLF